MDAEMQRLLAKLNANPGAPAAVITESETSLGLALPAEYIEFLKYSNGGSGFIGSVEYVIFWKTEELAPLNIAYEVQKYTPGLLIFGSNGGGEAYGFDTRSAACPIVRIPFIVMDWNDARPMGDSFFAFLRRLSEVIDE
ncbi:MAG TPA: SMI1/KNR4 family protein [Acidobacteriaceae bacterium]